jgi:glycerophosphoryl diester phosphodiesterase
MKLTAKTGIFAMLGFAAAAGVGKGIERLIWLHNYCKLVDYPVNSIKGTDLDDKDLKLIAHRGFRAVAPENTLPAYVKAGEAGFWGAECDVYRTKDGVWVLHHDPVTYRLMDKTKNPEKCTYEELHKLTYIKGHNIKDYPDLHITRLEEFFEMCKKYGMKAIIEIKYDRSADYMKELVDMAKQFDVETTYIAFDFINLQNLRKYTDAPLFYLVYDIKDKQIETAKTLENCGISFDGNDEKNLADNCRMIRKVREAGLDTATWAVDDLDIVRQIADTGTKYITTNGITY